MSEIAHEVEQMADAIAQNLHTVEHQKEDKIVFKKDIAPEWITEVIYAVHTAEGFESCPRYDEKSVTDKLLIVLSN